MACFYSATLAWFCSAVDMAMGMATFLARRGVAADTIWCWRDAVDTDEGWFAHYVAGTPREVLWLVAGIGGGLVLALFAHLYGQAVSQIPWAADAIRAARGRMDAIPGMAVSYGVIAILMAPLAEEYLFRGLLFRTLDRQWGGGWTAVAGAAAFFAIYHPFLSWLPVA